MTCFARFLSALCLLLAAVGVAAETLEVRAFDLEKDGREQAVFEVGEPGTLVVRVRVQEPIASAPVGVVLEGPEGLQVEKNGAAPLRLRYRVVDDERLGTWTVTVLNAGKMSRLTGEVKVGFEPTGEVPKTEEESAEVTDGKVTTPEDKKRIRAVCRDRNEDVAVRIDLEHGTGMLLLEYRDVARLEPRPGEDGVVVLRGDGERALVLDAERKILSFDDGELFCRVRVYYGGE